MATLLAHIRVRPGKEVQFERIAEQLHRATHEREADVRRYEYWRGAEPSTYYALESFDDLAGFVAHQTSEHHEAARPGLGEVIEDIRLEWVDPLPTASPLATTATAATPPDATELERSCYERFAGALMQDWWDEVRSAKPGAAGAAAAGVDDIDSMDPAV
jgi:quinol monooxygenase YgiN